MSISPRHDEMHRSDRRGAFVPAALLLLLVAPVVAGAARVVAGSIQGQPPSPPSAPVSAELKAVLMDEGQLVYGRDCAECHAQGGIGAALGGNRNLADKDRVITRILQGSPDAAMEAFGPSLTDREIAAVGTFVRNTWDNDFGAIAEADVKRVRDALSRKK